MSADHTTRISRSTTFTIPWVKVSATAVPKKSAPTNSKKAANMRAFLGSNAPVNTIVATIPPESLYPQVNSKAAAKTIRAKKNIRNVVPIYSPYYKGLLQKANISCHCEPATGVRGVLLITPIPVGKSGCTSDQVFLSTLFSLNFTVGITRLLRRQSSSQ